MKPRWLFLLLILALLLPGTRPRLVSAWISPGASGSSSPAENSSETEGEEEEIREGGYHLPASPGPGSGRSAFAR